MPGTRVSCDRRARAARRTSIRAVRRGRALPARRRSASLRNGSPSSGHLPCRTVERYRTWNAVATTLPHVEASRGGNPTTSKPRDARPWAPAPRVPRREWKACRDAWWLGPSVAAGRAVALGGEAAAADGAGWAGGTAGPFGIPLRCIARLAREVGAFGSAVGSTGLVILSVIRAMGMEATAVGGYCSHHSGSWRYVARLRQPGDPAEVRRPVPTRVGQGHPEIFRLHVPHFARRRSAAWPIALRIATLYTLWHDSFVSPQRPGDVLSHGQQGRNRSPSCRAIALAVGNARRCREPGRHEPARLATASVARQSLTEPGPFGWTRTGV